MEQTLQIAGMSCAACQHHVERALRSVPGVDSATVNLLANSAQITAVHPLESDVLIRAVRHAGYDASLPSATAPINTTSESAAEPNQRSLGLAAAFSLIAGALAMTLSMPLMMASHSPDPLLNLLSHALTPLTPAALTRQRTKRLA